jgi:hypothetical protein
MKRTSKRKLAVMAMAAVAIAGAVAAVGEGTTRHARHARVRAHTIGPRDLVAASGYLGLSTVALAGDLQAGKTLAEVANATPGKSADGLIGALVAEKRTRLQTLAGTLDKRVSAEVNRNGSARGLAGKRHRGAAAGAVAAPDRIETLAAGYLGLTPARLAQDLRSGQTLGQLADATRGRSAAGLVGTLVLARRERLAVAVAAHRITAARAAVISQRLLTRMSAAVDRRPSR